MNPGLRNYLIVTGGYWAFTLTDGAIRMLVVLYFHLLGYSPFEVAMLFLFYEFFGIVTNLVGGWLGARIGLNLTMQIGMGLQVIALAMLTIPDAWLSVPYVMAAQALSGIAKDLNKMSAKASIKTLVPESGAESQLFRWIALLTGSKNALKGVGFFLGGVLLQTVGFRGALALLAGALLIVLLLTTVLLPKQLGVAKAKAKFTQVFSKSPAINWLSAARFFLFGARDVWFVVGLPVYLVAVLGWSFAQVGGFLALWIIGYGIVQASAPRLIKRSHHGSGPDGATARVVGLRAAAVSDGPGHRARGRHRSGTGHRQRPDRLRRGVRDQLRRAFLSGGRLVGPRQGVDERRLLLHGQRRRPPARHGAVGRGVPDPGPDRLPVVVGGLRAAVGAAGDAAAARIIHRGAA
jgi:MFS family permease